MMTINKSKARLVISSLIATVLLAVITILTGCALEKQAADDPEPTPTVVLQTSHIKIDREHLPPAVNAETGEVENYLMVPHLIAPAEFYVAQPVDAPIEGAPGFPVARLAEAQAKDVQELALFVSEDSTFAEDAAGFGILSSIRYTFEDGRILTISTTHLSPAALEQTISFSGSSVMLPTYGEAWLDTGIGLPTTPRGLNFVKDNFIITVTGELSVDELLAIADQLLFQ